MLPTTCLPFCFGLTVLTHWGWDKWQTFSRRYFQMDFWNENLWILRKNSLKFVPKGQINIIPALVQIMVWCWPGDKPLSEPMMVSLLMHIYVTQPQWVNEMLSSQQPKAPHWSYGLTKSQPSSELSFIQFMDAKWKLPSWQKSLISVQCGLVDEYIR